MPPTPPHIFEPCTYDEERGGFFYRVTSVSPRRGPFNTRAAAVADAAWHLSDDLNYPEPGSEIKGSEIKWNEEGQF